jgi:predicted transcriptional regulator
MSADDRTLFMSLRPRFAELLLDGAKTVELRRVRPAVDAGALVLLYAASPTKALVGMGRIAAIETASADEIWKTHGPSTGVTQEEYEDYFAGAKEAVAISLRDVQRLDEPKPLPELREASEGFRPPQSFRYLDSEHTELFGLVS